MARRPGAVRQRRAGAGAVGMKDGDVVFNRDWRKACTVQKVSVSEVDLFIKAHYLKKRPAIVLLCLVAKCVGKPIGCVIYSAPPKQVDTRYGGVTWELARLYILDFVPKNAESWLIGKSVKYIKRKHKHVKYLISYADPSAGHSGTIYKAANWRADGMTDDERKTPRCDYYDANTGKKYGRRGNMPTDAKIIRKPRVSKFRYMLPL